MLAVSELPMIQHAGHSSATPTAPDRIRKPMRSGLVADAGPAIYFETQRPSRDAIR